MVLAQYHSTLDSIYDLELYGAIAYSTPWNPAHLLPQHSQPVTSPLPPSTTNTDDYHFAPSPRAYFWTTFRPISPLDEPTTYANANLFSTGTGQPHPVPVLPHPLTPQPLQPSPDLWNQAPLNPLALTPTPSYITSHQALPTGPIQYVHPGVCAGIPHHAPHSAPQQTQPPSPKPAARKSCSRKTTTTATSTTSNDRT